MKWTTCNVGADNPEEYGDYFAWGETSPKGTYTHEYVRGTLVTIKKNGNSIFFPATGYYRKSSLEDVMEIGYYRSGSCNLFEWESGGQYYWPYFLRVGEIHFSYFEVYDELGASNGLPVRPVSE